MEHINWATVTSSSSLASVLETTATLATHVGSATAMNIGAGRNVATAETVLDLLEQAANGQTNGVDKNVAVLAQNILRQSLDSAVA